MLLKDDAVLKTERLTLRRWRMQDREEFLRLSDDPEILRWTGRRVPSDELFRYYVSLDTAFAVIADGEVAGNISLFKNSVTDSFRCLDIYECTFYLFPQHQGKGYGTEALRAVLSYARSQLCADAVIAGAMPDNLRSIEMIKKNGGTFCFLRQRPSVPDEQFYVFSL
ncbi:MAG: GNAT family N-acetyltransferase [Oscillospiraceae bacterium]|nr:GNAT family N-acetyltransferase [Oscillospiraceae bacterium]